MDMEPGTPALSYNSPINLLTQSSWLSRQPKKKIFSSCQKVWKQKVCDKAVAVSDAVAIYKPMFFSLIHSSRTIMKVVEKKCSITSQMLFSAPRFGYVLEEFLDWISTTVKEVEEYHTILHCPVMVATHTGFTSGFRILFAKLHRKKYPRIG